MSNKKIYIILFAILYICVALVSTIHAISFFGLANIKPLAIILAVAFEIGQAAVLFSILTDKHQQKKVMPWVLMSILTLVQVMGNVYNSYQYLILNSESSLRFFKEPIFIWTQIEDANANVILAYIIGAILPIVSLLLTSMVTGFLNKDEEPKEAEYEEVEEPEEIEEIEETDEEPVEPYNSLSGAKLPEEEPEKKYVEEPDDNQEDKTNDEYVETIEEPIEEIVGSDMGDTSEELKGPIGESGDKVIEEIKQEEKPKSHFLNI